MKSAIRIASICGIAATLAGCRTFNDARQSYALNLAQGNYAMLPGEMAEFAAKKDNNAPLAWLYSAYGAYLADDAAAASTAFDNAEAVFLAHDAKGIFSSAASSTAAIMTNDKAFEYDGGGLDRVFVALYKAIGYMGTGQVNAARTELNRAAQYQDNWLYERRKNIADSRERLAAGERKQAKDKSVANAPNSATSVAQVFADDSFGGIFRDATGFDPRSSGDIEKLARKDYVNVYAEHVTGIFRWLNGDGGLSYLKDAAALAPANSVLARDAAECASGAKPQEQVWIWVEDGLCPRRKEWRIDLPVMFIPYANRYVLYAGMAFPVLEERAAATYGGISSNGIAAQLLQDVDALVRTEYDVYMRGALAREVTRAVARVAVQAGFGVAAEHASDRGTRLGFQLAQLSSAAWAAGMTSADTRSWDVLPKHVWCIRMARPETGRVDVAVGGRVVTLSPPAGCNTLVWIRQAVPLAAPVVKQVAF
ncbi:MAG: hypothetical protein IJ802_04580 [Kiritimatiellae bacterium]|nr:hypothetical protein [Kiritimatiellia bacterium]